MSDASREVQDAHNPSKFVARPTSRRIEVIAAEDSLGPENTMSQSPHDRLAELHNLAAHAHAAAAVAHGKGDHLTAHELTLQAHEHSTNARKLSEELAKK